MIVIFGGSHQGKTDFARKLLKLGEDDIYECCGTEADFSYRCISHLERLVLERLKADLPVFDWFDEHMEDFRDKVIICDDICCGAHRKAHEALPGQRGKADADLLPGGR